MNFKTEREEQACLFFDRSAGCLAQPHLATRTINFIQALPTTEGTPAKLMGWQQRFIRDLLKVNKGKRQVRNALLSCGRKNGKTGLASYLMLAHLFGALQQRGTRLYSVANDRAVNKLIT